MCDEVQRDAEHGDGGASESGGMAVPCSASGRSVGAILFIARVAASHRVAEAEKRRSRDGVLLCCSAVLYAGRGIDFFFLFIRLIQYYFTFY